MPQIETKTRRDIAGFLPSAIESALKSYQNFSEDQATIREKIEAKDFKEHHNACKIAIAHIQLLIELARWADLPDPQIEDEHQNTLLQSIIEKGELELGRE